MTTKLTHDELDACPFCGGEAKLFEGHRDHWRAECTHCGATKGGWRARDGAREEATAAWNTRAPSLLAQARAAEGMAEALDECVDVIEEDRAVTVDSHQIKSGPDKGLIDEEGRPYVDRYDKALVAAQRALARYRGRSI